MLRHPLNLLLHLVIAGTLSTFPPGASLIVGCKSSRKPAALPQPAPVADAKAACQRHRFPMEHAVGAESVQLAVLVGGVCGVPYTSHAWRVQSKTDPFVELLAATADPRKPLSFLHERTSPSGNRRIIAVGPLNETYLSEGRFVAWARLFVAEGVAPETQAFQMGMNLGIEYAGCRGLKLRRTFLGPFHPEGQVRVYAGQPDPEDASRFFYPFEYEGVRGQIRGQLNDDDTVTLSVDPAPVGRCEACAAGINAGPPPPPE